MAKYLPLPNGDSLKVPDSMGYEEAMALAQQNFPELFGETKPKKGGVAGAFGLGLESLLSGYQTAAGAITDPNEAARQALKRAQYRSEKYEEPTSLERVKKAYEEQGLLSAAGEVVSQIPSAIVEQAPQLGTLFGGARLGAMAGSPFGPVGTVTGGVLGAGAALLPQFFGSNIERQAAEQQKAGQPIDVSRTSALASAAGQTALEAAGTAFVFGGRLVSKLTKIPEEALLLGKRDAVKLADERLRDVLLKGTAKGFAAELPVELGQQMLERAQAGLSLTDADALKEYGQTAYQVGLLSPLGAVGRISDRSGARDEVAEKKRLESEAAAKLEAQRAEEEKARLAEERSKPDYLLDLQKRYDALVAKETELIANTKVKSEATDPASKQLAAEQRKAAVKELKDFQASPDYEALVQERVQAAPLLKKMEADRKAAEAVFGTEPTYQAEDLSDIGQMTALQKQIADLQKQQKGLTPAQQQPLQNRINALEDRMDQLGRPEEPVYRAAQQRLTAMLDEANTSLVDATSTADEQRIVANIDRLETALKSLQEMKPFVKTVTQMPSLSELRDQMDQAKAKGDAETIRRLVPQLAEAERQPELPFATGVESDTKLADEIATAREEAARRRETVAKETEALFRMGEKGLTPFEIGLRKSRLDEAREVIRQASKPSEERLRVGKPMRVQPGGALNQATRASLLVRENEQDWASFDKELKENAFRVEDREKLRDQLKAKLKDLETEYNEFSKYGPSKALELVRTETETLKNALEQVQRKLKIGRDRAVTTPDVNTQIAQASDARVAELIDRLLPLATGEKPTTAEEAQAAAERQRKQELGQASLFDVEAQRKVAAGIPEPEGGERRVEFKEIKPGVNMERTITRDGGTRTRVYRNGELTQDTTRYRYETEIDGEPTVVRVERNNRVGATEAFIEINGRASGSGLGISVLTEQGIPAVQAIRRVMPGIGDLKLIQPSEAPERVKTTDVTTPAPAKPAAQRVGVAPIEQAADLMERAKELRARLAEYNAAIQKAGRPSDPEKVARLNDLKDLRNSTLDELDNTQKQYAALAERQTPAFEGAEEVPGTADLFGGLEQARSEANRIQAELDTLYAERDDIRASMQRRGQVGATPQLQALADQYSKETPRLRQVEEQIDALETRLEEASGRKSERFDEFAQARERERQAVEDTRTRTLPGFERRAGLRPVDPAKLQDAQQRLVALQNVEEDLRKARGSGDIDPTRYLRQLATQKNEQYEAFLVQSNDPITKTWPAQKVTVLKGRYPKQIVPTERDTEWADGLRKQINYLNNVMKGRNKKSVETAFQDNLRQQESVRAEIADLERRQRAYEQQEAIRAGATPGTAEAERLIAGEGYRTPSGQVRTVPKKLASWGITEIKKKTATPATEAKVAMSSRVLRAYQKEAEAQATGKAAEKQTLEQQINRATKNIENMNNALTQVYPERVATETEAEIEKLLASGLTPEQLQQVDNMEQVYAALKSTTAGNTVGEVLARLNAEKERLLGLQGRFTARRGSVMDDKEQKTVSSTADQQIKDISTLIRDLTKEQSKKQDAWTTSFNALIKEKNSNALVASQELGFAQLELDSVTRKLNEMREGTQARIAELEKQKPSAERDATLAELNRALERQSALMPFEPGEVKAETEMSMSDWARRYELGAYNALLDEYNKVAQELDAKQFAYKKARLEQLGLTRAYGNDIKSVIDTEVSKIQTLTPQLEAKAKENAEAAAQLKKAEQMLAKARIEEREKAAQPPKDELAQFKYTAKERAALQRIREGLGLPGTRFETDTTSALATKTRKAVRDELNLRKAELEKAQAADNVPEVQKLTATIQRLEAAYESVMQLGERVITPVGEGAENRTVERAEPSVEPGTRLPRRRVGPVVKAGTQPPSQMLSGTEESRASISKGNRPAQAGTTRLTASDLSRESANSVSLAVLKQQLDAATGQRKTDLEAAYKAATDGMTNEQIAAKIKEGEDLIKLPGAAAVVAARERVRAATADVAKAEADLREAKTPAAKELARDALEMATEAQERAERSLEAAQANVAAKVELSTPAKSQAEKAIEDALAEAERERTGAPSTYAQRAAAEDEGDVAMEYTTATRTESSPATQDAIRDGRFTEAVERLAVDSDNPLIRETAEDIRRLLLRTKVRMVDNLTITDPKTGEAKRVPTLYRPSENTVLFDSAAEVTDEDIIHEAVHAVTLRVMRAPDADLTPQQRNAKREILAIYNRVKDRSDLKNEYGIENAEEFVSEVQSNVEFRAALDKQPWYKRLWHAITRLWSTKPIEKISDQAGALIKEIYLPSAKVTAGRQEVASIFRREKPPASAIIGYEPGKLETLRGNLFGLPGRVQYIDRLAAADEGIVKAEGAGKLSSTEAFNAQYFMRMGDKVTQAAGQFVTDGPVRIVADKVGTATEYRYESTTGANLVNVSTAVERAAKAGGMTPAEAEAMLTVLIAGQRANAVANGWERLQAKDPAGAKAEYNAYVNKMNANPEVKAAMEEAMREYKAYNEGLLNFAAQSGYLSKDEVRRLNKMPYVPFYRVEEGNVKLFVLGERPITIGNIKDSPDLKQFLGDEQKIQPILTSAVQNTFMLTRMAMHNKATMETSNALYKAGFASKIGKGAGPANPNTVHYKVDGEDHFATIDSDTFGIPAELIVRGMEGIKTTIPDVVKMLGVPADILRKFITRSPAYIVRQLVREPVNAFIVSGVDGVPIANALRELAKMRAGRSPAELALMRGLVVSSNIYTGGEADMQKFLGDVAAGRSGWDKFLGKLDTMALQADAATRATIYQDSLKKGFSEAKAQFRAMESANFGRRGLSPSMQVMSTLVPFFNAQIQGLDVLYRSFKGDMPFSQQLEIQRKIVARGSLLFAGALAYAFMMQDDDAYKKAKPEERYSNFFVHIPGVKDPLKLPVPFEVGLLFMGLPQAMVDVAMGNATGKEASKAIGKLLLNSAPGVIPAAPKPILEAFYGETTFGPIETDREKRLEASERFRPGTTEVAKTLGSFTGMVGISPLMIEHFVRGYTGGLGVALMSTLNPLLRSSAEGEKMPVGASRQPFIGGLFQPAEGRFLIERAYERMDDVVKAQQTYKDLMNRGQRDRAAAYAKENAALIAGAPMAGSFRQRMGELFDLERKTVANPKLSGAEKEARVQQLKDAQNRLARQFYEVSERTTRP